MLIPSKRRDQIGLLGGLDGALKYRMTRDAMWNTRRMTEQADKDLRQDAEDKYDEVND